MIIFAATVTCPICFTPYATHFSEVVPPNRSFEDVQCKKCKAIWNFSDEIEKTLNDNPILSKTNQHTNQ